MAKRKKVTPDTSKHLQPFEAAYGRFVADIQGVHEAAYSRYVAAAKAAFAGADVNALDVNAVAAVAMQGCLRRRRIARRPCKSVHGGPGEPIHGRA